MSASININGRDIALRGGQVYVDGVRYAPASGGGGEAPPPAEPVRLTLDRDGRIVGNVKGDLIVEGKNVTLVVEGDVEGSVTASGDVRASRVGGSASGRDITCESVGGSANAGNDVHAGRVGGSANAGRDVVRR